MKIADSSRYSQFPVKSRRDTTSTSEGFALALATIAWSAASSVAASPSAIGFPASGSDSRSSPKPEAWSYAASVAGTVFPSLLVTWIDSASTTR